MNRLFKIATIFLGVVLVSTLFAESAIAKEKLLSFGTASAGGTYYLLGAGVASVVNKHSNLRVIAESTAGSVENVNLAVRKKLDIGMSNYEVIARVGAKRDLSDLRVLVIGHGGLLHWFVRKDSPIKSFAELKGSRLGVGAPGSGHHIAVVDCLKYGFGLTVDDVKGAYLGIPETVSAIKDKTIDIGTIASTTPVPALLDLSSTVGIRFLSLPKEAEEKIAKSTYFDPGILEAGTYPGQDEDVRALYFPPAVVYTHKDTPENVAYSFIKALYEHPGEIKAIHPAGVFWTKKYAFRATKRLAVKGFPFHPGVIRYFKEIGIWNSPENGFLKH